MPGMRPFWMAALLLGAGLTAALGRAEEAPAPPLKDPASQTATVEETPSPPTGGAPTTTKPQPTAKPPPRPRTKSQPLKPFRPSEEIHVDKAVDFPADI